MTVLSVFLAAFAALALTAEATEYRGIRPGDANGRDGLSNPERGWRFEIGVGVLDEDPVQFRHVRDMWPFAKYVKDGATVSQAYCYLTQFHDRPISQAKLDALQKSFDRARQGGVKFLLRFAYEFRSGSARAPSCERILQHIAQLTPIVRRNADVIYCLQTGWIGLWGEFHGSANGLEKDTASVGKVVRATLEMLPEGRFTMMRTMGHRRRALGALDDMREIDAATAFTEAPHARIGFFNDGTLANFSDGGTFDKNPYSQPGNPDFDQLLRESRWMPVDGELFWSGEATCPIDGNALRAIKRFHDHHYTTFSLVHGYSELDKDPMPWTIDLWKKTPVTAELLAAAGIDFDPDYFAGVPQRTGFEFIRDHLGYRLKLLSSDCAETADGLKVTLKIRNYGFATPINPRQPVLVLVGADGACAEHPVDFDCRALQPGADHVLSATLPKPKDGERLALWLPAPEESLRHRPEYAIRLANALETADVGGRLLHFL